MRTLNLLLVDDESFVVDWLISLLDSQNDLPFNLFSCYGVTDAKAILETRRIDILLSDIRMPDGSGLDLAAYVHQRWADCKILILTAYSEFSYAQRAIHSNVDGYILKTEGDAYILKEIGRVAADLNAMLDQRQRSLDLRQDLNRYMLLYQNTLFFQWLHGELNATGQMADYMRDLDLKAELPLYLVMGRVHAGAESEHQEFATLRAKLSAQCMLEESTGNMLAQVRGNDVYFLLQPKPDYAQNYQGFLEQLFEIIAHSCHTLYDFRISFAISNMVRPDDLSVTYWALYKVLRDVSETSDTFLYRMPAVPAPAANPRSFISRIEGMTKALERGDEAAFLHAFSQIENEVSIALPTTDSGYQNAYLSVALALADTLSHGTGRMADTADLGLMYLPAAHASVSDAFNYLRGIAVCLLSEAQCQRQNAKTRLIAEIDQFLTENADHQFSLADISDHLNYNSEYLSRLYSGVTGTSLKRAITEKRLQFVESLMLRRELSINEICDKAGFKSRTYFNFFIKNILGTTPSEYRQALLAGKKIAPL